MLDLSKLKKVYIIGIKGSGVVAIAQIINSLGIAVTGSDTGEKFFTDEILEKAGIRYFENFSPDNIPEDADLVVYSTAYNDKNNIEFRAAKERKLPMMSYPEIVGELFNRKFGIAVCGTHGKTTTSALLAHVLREAGTDPSAIIGSRVTDWQSSVLSGQGEYLVLEADEYQNKLKQYKPKAVVLTSVDFDHPDFFENFNDYKEVFAEFIRKIPRAGFLVVWGDSTDSLEAAKDAKCQVVRYGFSEDCDLRIGEHQIVSTTQEVTSETGLVFSKQLNIQEFEVYCKEAALGKFRIRLVGRHNILNAAAAISVCHRLNLDMEKVRTALVSFRGTSRRFEYIGERNGAILIDDYGHHPEEIKATLKAARENYPDRNIIAVFHPHTFTRTKALLSEFAQSFDDADEVIILDIYGSAREEQGGVHSLDLVSLINKYDFGKAEHIATIPEVIAKLKDGIGGNDLVIAIGAGNVFEVVEGLKEG